MWSDIGVEKGAHCLVVSQREPVLQIRHKYHLGEEPHAAVMD